MPDGIPAPDDGALPPAALATLADGAFGLYVHGRHDTTGAIRSVDSIVAALPWHRAAETLAVVGDVTGEHTDAAYELGGTLAALLTT